MNEMPRRTFLKEGLLAAGAAFLGLKSGKAETKERKQKERPISQAYDGLEPLSEPAMELGPLYSVDESLRLVRAAEGLAGDGGYDRLKKADLKVLVDTLAAFPWIRTDGKARASYVQDPRHGQLFPANALVKNPEGFERSPAFTVTAFEGGKRKGFIPMVRIGEREVVVPAAEFLVARGATISGALGYIHEGIDLAVFSPPKGIPPENKDVPIAQFDTSISDADLPGMRAVVLDSCVFGADKDDVLYPAGQIVKVSEFPHLYVGLKYYLTERYRKAWQHITGEADVDKFVPPPFIADMLEKVYFVQVPQNVPIEGERVIPVYVPNPAGELVMGGIVHRSISYKDALGAQIHGYLFYGPEAVKKGLARRIE
jgi:hypothetical protein